jgi:protein-S-isoprenylcysteine O-methyltransferase Ste14
MSRLFGKLADVLGLALPPYGMACAIVIVLYTIQSEIRFGARARAFGSGASDRGSTRYLSIGSIVPIIGFAAAIKIRSGGLFGITHSQANWLLWPAIRVDFPTIGWTGAVIALAGVLLRLWAVIVLRERYTRTLLIHENHIVERGGPYRIVRHPGYLGSLLFFNGVALASCSAAVLISSIAVTVAAYSYRISVEDKMLIDEFGDEYRRYRKDVPGLIPFVL